MARKVGLVMVMVLLIAGSWSLGAQTAVADFEIAIEAPQGVTSVTCYRGCEWPDNVGLPATQSFECDSEPCRWTFTGRGPVELGFPLVSVR